MATNKIAATRLGDQQLRKVDSTGVNSPGLLAKWPMIGLLLVVFGGLVFGALTYNLLVQGPLLHWDTVVATTLPAIGLRNAAILKPVMDTGYYLGGWGVIILALLFGFYFIYKRYWRELAMLGIALAGETLLWWSVSNLIGRVRPPTQIWIILKIPGFPSGHAMAAVVVFGFLAYFLVPKMRSAFGKGFVVAVALLAILFIGFTRIFTGAHYLTDVLSGYALALAWFGLAITSIELYSQHRRIQTVKKG